ncbi:MAG: phosphodiester glycosidase family protein [Caldilineales bacterium]|nr:phosphodiester glycosidase family protein [Caldilineales bacterium]
MRFALRLLWYALVIVALTEFVPATTSVSAQSPSWRSHLVCRPEEQRYRGVEYCTAADGGIHVVVVDLHSPGVRLEYIIAEGLDGKGEFGECRDVNIPKYGPVRGGCAEPQNHNAYPVMSLTVAAELAQKRFANTAVVINSDYGACYPPSSCNQSHGPEGLTVVRGDRLDGPGNGDHDHNTVRRPWLVVSRDAPLRAELNQFANKDQDKGGKPYDWVYTGVGGAPWLVRDGQVQTDDIRKCKNAQGACYRGAMQTAVGLSQDRRWLFLVVDVRQDDLMRLADFMKQDLDVWDAMKFDGGGSSQLWYGGQTVVSGDGRRLSQYLAVIASPGNGIEEADIAAPLSAQPLSPLFFDLVAPGETARLRIEVRNTGQTTWQPGQGVELREVWKDVVSPIVKGYPLPQAVTPGETAVWEIPVNTGGERFSRFRFQMYQDDIPFGPVIETVVITLPAQLQGLEDRLRAAIEAQIEQWRNAAEEELERRMQDLEALVAEWIQRELEKQVSNLLEQLCRSAALAPLAVAFVLMRRRRAR